MAPTGAFLIPIALARFPELLCLPDAESLELTRRSLGQDLRVVNVPASGPFPAPSEHAIDRRFVPFDHSLHAAIRQVADPTRRAGADGFLQRVVAEAHALHNAADEDVNAFHGHIHPLSCGVSQTSGVYDVSPWGARLSSPVKGQTGDQMPSPR
jgi:hypothetical protein